MGNKPLCYSCLLCTKCVECVLSVIANRKNWVWGILACWTSFLSQAYLTNQFLHNLLWKEFQNIVKLLWSAVYAQYWYEEFPHFLVAQTKGLFVKVQLPGGQRVHFPIESTLPLSQKKLSLKMLAVTFDDNEDDNHVVLTRQRWRCWRLTRSANFHHKQWRWKPNSARPIYQQATIFSPFFLFSYCASDIPTSDNLFFSFFLFV